MARYGATICCYRGTKVRIFAPIRRRSARSAGVAGAFSHQDECGNGRHQHDAEHDAGGKSESHVESLK
jgi:hypothetical protein